MREAAERVDHEPPNASPDQGISSGYAYFKGAIVPFASAQVSIATHALHYGTGCFEGIRGYWNQAVKELYLVKLREHFQRFTKSARLLKMELAESVEELAEITLEVLRRDGYRQDVYVRPIAYKSSPVLKIDLHTPANGLAIFALPMGDYSSTAGLRVTISSWRRVTDNSIPARGKITGSYVNTALAVAPDGRIYAAEFATTIAEPPLLQPPGRIVQAGAGGPTPVVAPLLFPTTMRWGPDGLYVTNLSVGGDTGAGRVLRIALP